MTVPLAETSLQEGRRCEQRLIAHTQGYLPTATFSTPPADITSRTIAYAAL
jgi:hypothetical protein